MFAGRAAAGKKTVAVSNFIDVLMLVLQLFTAGDPMRAGVLWTNLNLAKIKELMFAQGISVSCLVIKRVLKSCGYIKRKMQKTNTLKDVADHDIQFLHIAGLREEFTKAHLPILSIDSKKKEMIGKFYREVKVYAKEAIAVNDHDFSSFSQGTAIPHGIYDLTRNQCYLSIGTNRDTAEFVMDNIEYR